MEKRSKGNIGFISAIIVVIVAIVVFCAVSVIFDVMTVAALPANYIGAALSSLIGALITLILLRGQTDIEEKKGKDIRILEKKTEVFQNYINMVWKIWENEKITVEEFQNLTSQYYQNLMIYLNDEPLKIIGDALTAMGGKIDKNTYDDMQELQANIVTIINTLCAEIDLGGQIDPDIIKSHDKILFPILFRRNLLNELNKKLKDKGFKEGKFEIIKDYGNDREFMTFEMEKFSNVFLSILVGSGVKNTDPIISNLKNIEMAFMANYDLDMEFRRQKKQTGSSRYRFGLDGHIIYLSKSINDGEDNTPPLDFTNEESIQVFREKIRDFPTTLAERVMYHIKEWKDEDLGIFDFLEKKLGQMEAK